MKRLPVCLAIVVLAVALLGAGPAMAKKPAAGNRLAKEKSPYLLQHADNPVNWYPWGQEAFAKAAAEDKPIFLSIGYSACHWCGVMEKESFADRGLAALMNQTVVAVKVDREERPDIDQLYMGACQLLSSSCGWPLTILMTAEQQPFLIATYLPKEDRAGRPGLVSLLNTVKKQWATDRPELLRTARTITDELARSTERAAGEQRLVERPDLISAYNKLAAGFDAEYGGFGSGSKFPQAQELMFLLRYWHRSGEPQALAMVEKSLRAMRRGAIFDQLGYGFHRYTTDRAWRRPHFEKMLYDQALLTITYLEAYQAARKPEYAGVAREVIGYVLGRLTSGEGVFYASEAADSKGGEGSFYLWRAKELQQALGRQDAETLRGYFNVETDGNFPDQAVGEGKTGLNILYRNETMTVPTDFEAIRARLLAARNGRPRPAVDDKVLTDWNALMIAALARAASSLDEPAYGEAAARAADFILKNLRDPSGRLLHRWRAGEAGLAATAADYTYLIWGLIELYEWSFDARWLEAALRLNNELVEHFWDDKKGGFFLTPNDGEPLLVRTRPARDRELPSVNSVALMNLYRLSRLTSQPGFEEKAADLVKAFSDELKKAPADYPMFLAAAAFVLWPSHEVVIVGSHGAEDTRAMLKALRERFIPDAVVQFRPAEQQPAVLQYAPFMEFMAAAGGKATAYVCTDFNCKLPTTDIERMLQMLKPAAGAGW